jgi:hypothetical protein
VGSQIEGNRPEAVREDAVIDRLYQPLADCVGFECQPTGEQKGFSAHWVAFGADQRSGDPRKLQARFEGDHVLCLRRRDASTLGGNISSASS